MGGIFAKLDNQDKVVSLERKENNQLVRDELSLNLDVLKDYINKHGYIRVEMDLKQLETYINSFGSKYFNKNINEIKSLNDGMGMGFGIMSMMLSSFGLFVLSEHQIEQFDDVIGHEQNDYNVYESFLDVGNVFGGQPASSGIQQLGKMLGQPVQQPVQQQASFGIQQLGKMLSVSQPVVGQKTAANGQAIIDEAKQQLEKILNVSQPVAEQQIAANVQAIIDEAKKQLEKTLTVSEQVAVKPLNTRAISEEVGQQLFSFNKIKETNAIQAEIEQQKRLKQEQSQQYYILLPKIYFYSRSG
jgi:hypothetical protein